MRKLAFTARVHIYIARVIFGIVRVDFTLICDRLLLKRPTSQYCETFL